MSDILFLTVEMAEAAMAETSIPRYQDGVEVEGPVWWFEDFLRFIAIDPQDGTTITVGLNDEMNGFFTQRYQGDDPSDLVDSDEFETLAAAVAFAATI